MQINLAKLTLMYLFTHHVAPTILDGRGGGGGICISDVDNTPLDLTHAEVVNGKLLRASWHISSSSFSAIASYLVLTVWDLRFKDINFFDNFIYVV